MHIPLEEIYAHPERFGRGGQGQGFTWNLWATGGVFMGAAFVGSAVIVATVPPQQGVLFQPVIGLVGMAGVGCLGAATGKVFKRVREKRKGAVGSAAWGAAKEIVTSPECRWVIPVLTSARATDKAWSVKDGRLVAFAPPEGDAVCTHYLMLGASGSGKGASIFSHIMASSKVPTIYQDVKAECPNIDHPKWRDAIRWGCAADGGWPSMRWNPIEECRRDPDPMNAFETLAAVLLPDNEGEDAWVSQVGRPILAELLRNGPWKTLGEFANEVYAKPLLEILGMIETPGGLKGMLEGKNVKEYVASTFFANLSGFRVGWGRDCTEGHDFGLDDLIDRGGYILSAETQETRKVPLRLLWTLLLRKLMRSARKRPVNLLMDEALAVGKIPSLHEALVTLRSRAVSVWMGVQSEGGLISVYEEKEGKAILAAFGNRVYLLHGLSPEDAETLSKRMRSWSKPKGGHWTFGMGMSGPSIGAVGGSDDVSPMPLITPDEIERRGRNLRERWGIIVGREVTTNGNPLICRLVQGRELTRLPSEEEILLEKAKLRTTRGLAFSPSGAL